MSKDYVVPKYPRVQVSEARHKKLMLEAKKNKKSLLEVVESKLKIADKALKATA